MGKELRIGVTGMSPAGEVRDPYAGVNLAAAENPNFADGMNHYWWDPGYYFEPLSTGTLPLAFAPSPAVTTGCWLKCPTGSSGISGDIVQDKVEIPDDVTLPAYFTAGYYKLQVNGVEGNYSYFQCVLLWYDADGAYLTRDIGPTQMTDTHAWQRDEITALSPAGARCVALGIRYNITRSFDMYYTATKLERVSTAPPARNLDAFAVSRDSAGILLAVRDNAAPQFNVGRDADGLTISVPR